MTQSYFMQLRKNKLFVVSHVSMIKQVQLVLIMKRREVSCTFILFFQLQILFYSKLVHTNDKHCTMCILAFLYFLAFCVLEIKLKRVIKREKHRKTAFHISYSSANTKFTLLSKVDIFFQIMPNV